ncbi:MAG: M81 family metallopeptidase [Halobacteriales archaeon]|nr:M81 family metallopeptidase [Halobacteriales archaeon]
MGQPRVLLAEFNHETNTFSTVPTERADFQNRREYTGEAVVERLRGSNTAIGGAIDIATAEDVEVEPVIAAAASPSGPVTTEAYEFYTTTITDAVRANQDKLDGILLALHGAMVPEGMDDGEGPLVTAVREIVGDTVPIVVTLDLHGNISDELVETADALVAYETYPHVDMGDTGREGMTLLLEIINGETEPVMWIERPPVLPHEPFEDTGSPPMQAVVETAREMEDRPGVRKTNLFFGFHQVDNPTMGFSIPVVGDGDPGAAKSAARELAELVWEQREAFVGEYPDPHDGVARAKRLAADRGPDAGPIVAADLGPNAAAGGSADGTPVLRELLAQEVTNAGYAVMRDPDAVEQCINAGVGERVTLTLGGKTDDQHGEPIEDVDGYVAAITDGVFENTGPMDRGTISRLGRTVLLECGADDGVAVILTEQLHSPRDAELWRHVGRPPERFDVLIVQGTNHFRADYAPLASEVFVIDSPGVGSPIPTRYDYTRIRRPQFPIDAMADDAYPPW